MGETISLPRLALDTFAVSDWVLTFGTFGLGLGIFLIIGIGNMGGYGPMTWVRPALTIYLWGGALLLLALYIPSPSIRLTILVALLLSEVTVIIGYTVQSRLRDRNRQTDR